MIEAGVAKAEALGCKVSLAVVDQSCRLIAFENALSMAVRMGDFTNVPGGLPIEINGEVIGAVAAGGAKIEQDVEVAKAALAALQSQSALRRFAANSPDSRASHRAPPAPP